MIKNSKLIDPSKKAAKKNFIFPSLNINPEKSVLVENLTLLLSSGLNISLALNAVKEEIRSAGLKKTVAKINAEVENGSSLWRALEKVNLFSASTIALIKIGEESGRLSENLKIVAEQTEKNKNFRSKLRSALMYPIFVLILAAIITIGVSWFILPRLANIFDQMDIALPTITVFMINWGKFLNSYGYVAAPTSLVTLLILLYFLFLSPSTKFIGQSIIFAVPGLKKLIQETELARFGYLLGTLLRAGLPIEQALESLENSSTFYRYQKLYSFLKTSVEDGNSFQKSFTNYPHLKQLVPLHVQQMIVAGEQSGNLADILIKLGASYENKTESTTKNLMIVLEPVLLIIVWLGVVTVALAIILPIYSLIGGFNKY